MATQGNSGAASGGQLEEKIDYTKETDACLLAARDLVAARQLSEALTVLAAGEKKCRAGNDTTNLARLCTAAVTACRDCGDHEAVRTTLTTWSTKRSQKSAAIAALVSTALPWCLDMKDIAAATTTTNTTTTLVYTPVAVSSPAEQEIRDGLVVTLRDITDGKLFLERERAQLTRAWATIQVSVLPHEEQWRENDPDSNKCLFSSLLFL
jgi:26S proteasome regulatory subunit N5